MAKLDLRTMSVKEMKALRTRLDKAITNKNKQVKGKVLKEITATAKAAGYKLEDLVSGPRSKKGTKGRKLAPKYRHPENTQISWSGVGRRPKWIEEATKAGTLDKLKL